MWNCTDESSFIVTGLFQSISGLLASCQIGTLAPIRARARSRSARRQVAQSLRRALPQAARHAARHAQIALEKKC